MIEEISDINLQECARLAKQLWPESALDDLVNDFKIFIGNHDQSCFLFKNEQEEYCGFVQLSLRNDYVEGSSTTPVAYIEGIYVDENHRRTGASKEMIAFAEEWGRLKGCSQMGSDCELTNTLSIEFHKGVGFTEANRIVCFLKELK
jgi:aminoglycoside 6'-N-acetyltransferase I